MAKRRNILWMAVLVLSVSALSSCASYRNLSLSDYRVASLSPRGMRALDAELALVIFNPSGTFRVSDVRGIVRHRGEAVASFSSDGLSISRRSEREYSLPLSGELAPGTSLFQLMQFPGWKAEDVTVDVDAKVRLRFPGFSKKVRIRDCSLADLQKASEKNELKKKK